jgi:hypothetical protein
MADIRKRDLQITGQKINRFRKKHALLKTEGSVLTLRLESS